MEKKKHNKKSLQYWKCNVCGDITKMCKHLENLVDNTRNMKDVKYITLANIDALDVTKIIREDKTSLKSKEKKFRKLLNRFHIEKIRRDVLVYRFVYNWSFREISAYLKIPSVQTAFYIYKKSLELLREQGLKK